MSLSQFWTLCLKNSEIETTAMDSQTPLPFFLQESKAHCWKFLRSLVKHVVMTQHPGKNQ